MSKKNKSVKESSVEVQNTSTHSDMMWLVADTGTKYTTEQVFDMAKVESRSNMYDVEVGIGTDSQIIGKNFRFVTVICIYRKGKGGFYFYKPESMPREKYNLKNQKLRMFDEVARSIDLSLKLQESTGIVPIIHVDASPVGNGQFTSGFSDQLKGYIQSCGFDAMLKPESYVANCIADHHSKSKSMKKDRRRLYC